LTEGVTCDESDTSINSVAKVIWYHHSLRSKFDDSDSGNAGSPLVGRAAPVSSGEGLVHSKKQPSA